uniref:Uncharacterized protein n=1 Tax=Globodera rostochiensis TaxID=31243 RepID=A0A914GSZ8_GLORO
MPGEADLRVCHAILLPVSAQTAAEEAQNRCCSPASCSMASVCPTGVHALGQCAPGLYLCAAAVGGSIRRWTTSHRTVHSFQAVHCSLFPSCSLFTLSKLFTVHSFQAVHCSLFPSCSLFTLSKLSTRTHSKNLF